MTRKIAVEILVMRDRALIPSGSAELRMEGSTWYGNVPSDWNVDRFKRIATIRNGQVDPEDDRYKDLPLFAPNHIESATGRLLEVESADAQGAESGKFLVEPGEVVYVKIRPELRKVIVAPSKGLCSADMYPVSPGYRVESRFLYYEMLSDGFSQYTVLESDRVAMPKINRKALGECIFLYPDRKQQARICEYLDSSCAAIDAAVAAKRRQLETLDAVMESIIETAVTRGLNGKTKLRVIDHDWIGSLPEHWAAVRIKRVISRLDYGISVSSEPEGKYPVLKMANIQGGEIVFSKMEFVDEVADELLLEHDDLLYNRTNSPDQVGKAALFLGTKDDAVTFASYLVRLRVNHRIIPEFLNFAVNCGGFLAFARRLAIPSVQQSNLNSTRYGRLHIPIPSVTEQRAICEHLNTKVGETKRIVTTIETQIATLTGYRKSLIHECVTGQRRITEADVAQVRRSEAESVRR